MPEVIVALVEVVGLLFLILSYLTYRGLLAGWVHTFGYVFQWLGANARIPLPWPFKGKHVDFGGPFRAVDHEVFKTLQAGCQESERAIGMLFHGLEELARLHAEALKWVAHETAATFDWLEHVRLPRWAKQAALVAIPGALLARLTATILARVYAYIRSHLHAHTIIERTYVTRLPRALGDRLTRDEQLLHQLADTVAADAGAITLPHPKDVAGTIPAVKGLGRWAWRVNRRLHRLELLFGAAAMAAAMANVLGLPSWRCLTRGNIGKTARRLCGLGPQALNDLLGLLVDTLILTDICEVATLMADALQVVEGPLNDLVGAVDAALCHGDYGAPPLLNVPLAGFPLPTPIGLSAV